MLPPGTPEGRCKGHGHGDTRKHVALAVCSQPIRPVHWCGARIHVQGLSYFHMAICRCRCSDRRMLGALDRAAG